MLISAEAFSGFRVKRQDSDDEEEDTQKKICAEAGAEAGEWFRLQAGADKCRDVVSCTASVRQISSLFTLFTISEVELLRKLELINLQNVSSKYSRTM